MIKRVTRMPSGAGVEQLFAECDADPRVFPGERGRSRVVAEASGRGFRSAGGRRAG